MGPIDNAVPLDIIDKRNIVEVRLKFNFYPEPYVTVMYVYGDRTALVEQYRVIVVERNGRCRYYLQPPGMFIEKVLDVPTRQDTFFTYMERASAMFQEMGMSKSQANETAARSWKKYHYLE